MTEAAVNVDDILDATLDDLEDLPTFQPFPAGVHKVLLTLESKEVNKHPCIEVNCKMIETLELSEPTQDTAPVPGSVANTLCMLDNEFGRGNFKMVASALAEILGTRNNREIVDGAKDIECLIVTSIKTDKSDPSVKRMNIKEVQAV